MGSRSSLRRDCTSEQRDLELGHYSKRIPTHPVLDCGDQRSFGRGFSLYLFERISLGSVENYIYWCIGNLSDSPGD